MPAFPIAKLAAIIIKQVGKPLANIAKERAKTNHFFRIYICMPPAQFYHWCEVRMKMYVMNIGKTGDKATIPKLNEQAAIELGANLLGETVIFSIAVAVLGYEYNRQRTNERNKEENESRFLLELESKIDDLAFSNEKLDTEIREIRRLIYSRFGEMSSSKALPESNAKSESSQGVIANAVENVKSKLKGT